MCVCVGGRVLVAGLLTVAGVLLKRFGPSLVVSVIYYSICMCYSICHILTLLHTYLISNMVPVARNGLQMERLRAQAKVAAEKISAALADADKERREKEQTKAWPAAHICKFDTEVTF